MSTSKKQLVDEPSYHHGNLREALLSKGLELLEAGQSDFSLRELTRQVGVSANAAYRHFASKEALLSAMAAEGFRQLAAAQAMAVQGGANPALGFMAAGRAYVDYARQHPALFRLMFGRFAASNPDAEMQAAAQLAYQGLRFGVAAVLKRPVESAEVLAAAMHAWSLVHGLSQLIIDGQMEAHTTDVDGLIDAVLLQAVAFRGTDDFTG
ncbi:MAG: TetR/AcrR family transcriptional regulator [Pedobacter sp.]|nr:TetR/AcrR family transcriptional regulator [Pedobacter sp.]